MKHIIIGEKYKEKYEFPLKTNGFVPFWLPENTKLDPRLSSHADLSVFIYDNKAIIAPAVKSENLVNLLTNRGYEIITARRRQDRDYPGDVNLCAAVVGKYLMHNLNCTDEAIIENIGLKRLHINQGYARCTSLIFGTSIITSDRGVAAVAENIGIDVLMISSGEIILEGFNEGFIGGASFVDGNTIYFTGDIETHPDGRKISGFIFERGFRLNCLDSGPLIDIGGAVCLK